MIREKPSLSNAQINFFWVEIRNEEQGGVSPATLGSAAESALQAPDDVLIDWCDDYPIVNDKETAEDFRQSIYSLLEWLGDVPLLDVLTEG